MINFFQTNKVRGIPLSKIFIGNISSILENTHCIHYYHITEEILGHAHTFCNEKVRENYYRIPIIAHNLLRFDFFSYLRGLGLALGELEILL